MTTIQHKKSNPIAHLSAEDIEMIGVELDAIRDEVMASRGAKDAAYIRRVIKVQRGLELSSRAVLLFSLFPPAWLVGTAALSVAKILENMEVGHNILHGQWDWMRDPKIHSTKWEWDHASPAEQWKHSHNELHHTYTNVVGRDNDLGYGIMRVDEEQKWAPAYLGQPFYNLINACLFEYGIAAYDLELGRNLQTKERRRDPKFRAALKATRRKIGKQMLKDYVVHPALSGPSFLHTIAANATANLIRNLWSHSVIMCGHFPNGVETFEKTSIEGETRGEWYLRQMLGSANISGSKLMHIMTGNLSHQIEHHLFPDMPSNRYAQIAPKIKDLFERYGLKYTTGPMPKQVASAWWKVIRLSLPSKPVAARPPAGERPAPTADPAARWRRVPATPELAQTR
ncbi:acyl-CoA desaturase [Actinoplanes sp. N902-109]|uniref:fatty acid desaturase family protein n=1 Tax=Actinoplanes sp. (strain N902-109) TaxID=649831 RepID=UPI0003295B6A|nr:acyl-CoA desaturase [Actinoplanes sp. N902-109]AGL18908.1 fatty acid desaturase [Actinoplanes sp. N902-109]